MEQLRQQLLAQIAVKPAAVTRSSESDMEESSGEDEAETSMRPSDDAKKKNVSNDETTAAEEVCRRDIQSEVRESPSPQVVEAVLPSAVPSSDDEKTAKLRRAKEKLRHAKAKLVSALHKKKRQHSLSPTGGKPETVPSYIQPGPLMVRGIDCTDERVRFLPDLVLLKNPCHVIPADARDDSDGGEDDAIPDLQQKGEALRKMLQLKRKKLELRLKMQQRKSPPPEERKPPPLTKEALIKRQEELQQTVDAAYWKRLILKQRNLLQAQESKVAQHAQALETMRHQMHSTKEQIKECQQNIQDAKIREECLDEMIVKTTQQVLSARKQRYDQQQKRQNRVLNRQRDSVGREENDEAAEQDETEKKPEEQDAQQVIDLCSQ